MIRVGVIGLRGIGNNHATTYHNHKKSDLLAVCDMVKERADDAAERYGAKAYYSIDDMLNNEELDVVSVATGGFENGGDHYEPVIQCLEAGLDVLCEKPISNNIEHARDMVKTAQKKNLRFAINLNHRFVPPAEKAKKWIDEGKLGQLLIINMTMWIGNPAETSPWFHLKALHPHSIDIMRYFCGDVARVQAFLNKGPGRSGDNPTVCWSNAQINMHFENDVVGHLTGSYDTNPAHNLERCEVMGSEGRFVLDNCFEELTLYPRRSEELTVIRNSIMGGLVFNDTFPRRINRWIEQVDEGVPRGEIDGSGEEGLAVQEIITAAIRSWEENAIIDVAKVPGT
ncbi:MAG: Gfo/Idh/MocA family oxidoreductase [bacterium]|nr:Gfo/Idh/MocA family oxidoreductase [bacterium]